LTLLNILKFDIVSKFSLEF